MHEPAQQKAKNSHLKSNSKRLEDSKDSGWLYTMEELQSEMADEYFRKHFLLLWVNMHSL
jgi:hypothetical protein